MNLTITGGEPFTHPLITHFLDITRQLGFVINIQSNLILLDDAILSALQNNIVSDVSVSLYSTNAAEHDAITQFAGSMHKTVANIRRLIANGIPVSINCPVMSANQNSMIDLCRFAKELNIDVKFALKIIPSQNQTRHVEHFNVFDKDFILSAMCNPEIGLYAKELNSIRKGKSGVRYCQTGFRSITFNAQGEMLICNAYRKPCGSLNDVAVEDLWQSSPVLNHWRERTSLVRDECRECPAYSYCEPCPAHSYTQSGDEDSIDQLTCLFGKAFYAADIDYLKKGGEINEKGI
jgi:radical SAM protein with 4Fe4S-binding SPASM domain